MKRADLFVLLKLLEKEVEKALPLEFNSSKLLETIGNKEEIEHQNIRLNDEGGGYFIAQVGELYWSFKKTETTLLSPELKERVSSISNAYIKKELFGDVDSFYSLSKKDVSLLYEMKKEYIISNTTLSSADMKTLFFNKMKTDKLFGEKLKKELGLTKITKSGVNKIAVEVLVDAEKHAGIVFLGKYFEGGYTKNTSTQVRITNKPRIEDNFAESLNETENPILKEIKRFLESVDRLDKENLSLQDKVSLLSEKLHIEKQIETTIDSLALNSKEIEDTMFLNEIIVVKFDIEDECDSLMKPKLDLKKLGKKIDKLKGVNEDEFTRKQIFRNLGFSSTLMEAKITIDTNRSIQRKGSKAKLAKYNKNLFVL